MSDERSRGTRRLLVESPAPRIDVARGFSVTGGGEELLRRFEAEPHTERVDFGGHGGPLRVLRWRLDPAVAEVSAPELDVLEGSASATPVGSLLVDSRVGTVLLRFEDAPQKLELRIERGHISLFAVDTAASGLPAFEPRVATGGEPLRGWLAGHVRELLESGAPLERVAAVGALVRFWQPATITEDASSGPPEVVRGARAWARSVDAEAWVELEGILDHRIAELSNALERIGDGEDDGDPFEVALERDVLESVSVTMRLAGRDESWRGSLVTLDERARAKLTALTDRAAAPESERLAYVAWSEPEAWWGAVAG